MLNLKPHHRLHVPNGLAVLAAVLLLVSTVASFDSGLEVNSASIKAGPALKAESSESEDINDGVASKRRGLNLGFLLFRRG